MKKRTNTPRRKRMKRNARMDSARQWIATVGKDSTYCGKNAVRRYAKWYGVDLLCAITEVRLLGITVDEEYEQLVKKSIDERVKIKKLKKEKRLQENMITSGYGDWCDDEFAFIAGYTSGGAPYGIRHDEMDGNGNFKYKVYDPDPDDNNSIISASDDRYKNQDDAIDDELPF